MDELSLTYIPGSSERIPGVTELASNESVYGPSPMAASAAALALSGAHLYPEATSRSLRARLASHWALSPDHVLVSAGTTGLIDLIARVFVGPGKSAVMGACSFLAYAVSVRAWGGELLRAPMCGDAIDLDAVLAAVRPDTSVIFLANPNNPTGTAFGAERFGRFLAGVPPHVSVVLDEAYAEYTDAGPWGPEMVGSGVPILVLRTFSKVFGLAGVRIGYALGPVEHIERLARVTPPFGVSQVAATAAAAALADTAHVARVRQATAEGRARLIDGLRRLGLSPRESTANFVYVDLGRPADAARDALLAQGVRVRSLAGWGAPTAIRITVGRPPDITRVLCALEVVGR